MKPHYRVITDWVGLLAFLLASCQPIDHETQTKSEETVVRSTAVPVRLVRTAAGGYELQRQGKPYFIKGAGGLQHVWQVRAAGGNSIRLWTTDYAQPLLDSAQANGLTVLLGVWLTPERDGFNFYDTKAVEKRLDGLREEVLQYRNHPALLAWDVGNELDLGGSKNPEAFRTINRVAQLIHELDPNHPVLSTFALPATCALVAQYCPDVDIVGFNSYGGLLFLDQDLRQVGSALKPYIVTEFGARGPWESPVTRWQAPLEQPSREKAEFMAERYRKGILANSQLCLGGYLFYWGNRYEATPTWFSLFTPTGERTEIVDEIQHLWTGRYPVNRAPQMGALRLNAHFDSENIILRPSHRYPAALTATDPEQDSLRVRWEVRPDFSNVKPAKQADDRATSKANEPVPGCIQGQGAIRTTVIAPQRPGAYRLFAQVTDTHGGAATANIPFWVSAVAAP